MYICDDDYDICHKSLLFSLKCTKQNVACSLLRMYVHTYVAVKLLLLFLCLMDDLYKFSFLLLCRENKLASSHLVALAS